MFLKEVFSMASVNVEIIETVFHLNAAVAIVYGVLVDERPGDTVFVDGKKHTVCMVEDSINTKVGAYANKVQRDVYLEPEECHE